MADSDSELSDLAYDDDEVMQPSSGDEDGLDEDQGVMSEGDVDYDDDATSVDDESGFDLGVVNTKGKKPSYQVDYTPLSLSELQKEMKKEIDHVAGFLSISDKEAGALLRYLKWNKERVIERYMEDPKALRQAAGLDEGIDAASSSTSQPRLKRIKGFLCEICYDDSPEAKETIALSCDHRYCRECYTSYLVTKIMQDGESKTIQCMSHDCTLVIDERTVEMLVDDKTMDRYRELLNRSYVDDDPELTWCPGTDCEYAVRCPGMTRKSLETVVPTVKCGLGHKFCFGCQQDDHQPCICAITKLWKKKCADDSETANWISANTKECPKCAATIEKNGGCNHMTCKKCKYEFCWICMGEWSAHGTSWYNCNRYDDKKDGGKDAQSKSRASLERYLFYYNRYSNHEQSAKLEKETYARIERRMEEMQNHSDLSWIEVQFLKKAVDILAECRVVLKWTYAMAFYLVKNNHTAIFEDNQADLELAVENLSELLETPVETKAEVAELRQKTLDRSAYVQKRHEVMLEDTLEGYADDRWQWTVTLP